MPSPFLFPQCVALQALNLNLSLRGTGCRGNLGGAVAERFVSPHFPSAEIASSLALLAKTGEFRLSTTDYRLSTIDCGSDTNPCGNKKNSPPQGIIPRGGEPKAALFCPSTCQSLLDAAS